MDGELGLKFNSLFNQWDDGHEGMMIMESTAFLSTGNFCFSETYGSWDMGQSRLIPRVGTFVGRPPFIDDYHYMQY